MFRSQNAWYRAASLWLSERDAEEDGEHAGPRAAGNAPSSKRKKKMNDIVCVGKTKRRKQPLLEEQAAVDALLGLVRKSPYGQIDGSRSAMFRALQRVRKRQVPHSTVWRAQKLSCISNAGRRRPVGGKGRARSGVWICCAQGAGRSCWSGFLPR